MTLCMRQTQIIITVIVRDCERDHMLDFEAFCLAVDLTIAEIAFSSVELVKAVALFGVEGFTRHYSRPQSREPLRYDTPRSTAMISAVLRT
ncbi:hypothetical protein D9M69_666740 [compost metagenome]